MLSKEKGGESVKTRVAFFPEPLEKEISVEDMQKIVDASKKSWNVSPQYCARTFTLNEGGMMSLFKWKTIYYPVPAGDINTQADAIDHSILKWSGLWPEVLRVHGIERYESILCARGADAGFPVDVGTCALCHLDDRAAEPEDSGGCTTCPLYKSRDNVDCTNLCAHEATSPYGAFIEEGDPEPMLMALHKAKAWLEKQL